MRQWFWVSFGSSNSLSPVRRQVITWTNADLLSIGPLGTNFNEIEIKMKKNALCLTERRKPENMLVNHLMFIRAKIEIKGTTIIFKTTASISSNVGLLNTSKSRATFCCFRSKSCHPLMHGRQCHPVIPRLVWALGYFCRLRLSMCVVMHPCDNHELVRAMIHHLFKLGYRNLDQSCKHFGEVLYCFGGRFTLTFKFNLNLKCQKFPRFELAHTIDSPPIELWFQILTKV